ncbi:hypothetical protein ACHWQZ_G012336 [Mnemiopsis leidyi]
MDQRHWPSRVNSDQVILFSKSFVEMGKQYFCDYCVKGFPDNRSSRQKHLKSNQHKMAYKEYYSSQTDPLTMLCLRPKSGEICKNYEKLGKCDFGDSCKYSHFNSSAINKLKADKIQDLESKSIEDWTNLCLEKRRRVQDVPNKLSQKQSAKKISKQINQNLPPSMQGYTMLSSINVTVVQRIKDVLDILYKDDLAKESTKQTVTQSIITGSAAMLGAIIGGRAGGVVGGLAGAVAGTISTTGYKPLAKCTSEDSKAAIAEIMKEAGLVAIRELVKNAPGLLGGPRMALVATQYLKGVIDILMEYEETEKSTTYTVTQTLVAGGGALLGAFFGGRSGGLIGGLVGAAAGGLMVPDYKPLVQCLQEMDDDQKQDIARKIQNRVGNVGQIALKEFVRNVPQNVEWLKQQFQITKN